MIGVTNMMVIYGTYINLVKTWCFDMVFELFYFVFIIMHIVLIEENVEYHNIIKYFLKKQWQSLKIFLESKFVIFCFFYVLVAMSPSSGKTPDVRLPLLFTNFNLSVQMFDLVIFIVETL